MAYVNTDGGDGILVNIQTDKTVVLLMALLSDQGEGIGVALVIPQ